MNIADLTVPGVWRCPKCQFTQVNQTLAPDGIGADTRPHLFPCPNDGRDMVPVTWREHAEELELRLIGVLDSRSKIESQHAAQVSAARLFGSECDAARALLRSLFNTSAELRFAIKAGTRSIETNSSWHRHTEVMKQVEEALKTHES